MPFVKTAYLGSEGADIFKNGDNIQHCGAVRVRVTGSGNLIMTLQSMQEVKTQILPSVAMADPTTNVVEKLSNFKQQRMSLKLETTEINEIFRINRITLFFKELWSSLPR